MLKRLSLSALFLLSAGAPAFAHLNPAEHGSFSAGFSHPLFGADHILAMVAVGLWAWMIGGRAIRIVPAAFVGTMLFGFVLALVGVPLPFVEPAILASVVALGLLVAVAAKLPVLPAAVIVGVFALFHGHAHGGELGSAGALGYAAGFAIATAALHAVGLGFGFVLGKVFGTDARHADLVARLLGGLTAAGGLYLIAG
ncbi:HupE/UreJ family protein [Oricola sp.]|uniref:HupE/UreJ family protein n=1 Tax=Oricola sp. TaxID=1979950 RepID=UPI0025F470EC|nr:HupE/UreJ family protein [Oricola sp.]MCI5074316.1 HupE/UreJ family protein [Oricola sp.]